jgi:5-methylcytosine-specific restriction protein A
MPWAPRRPCGAPRCAGFADPGRSYCTAHQRESWRQQNAQRPRELRAFYDSPEWRSLRAAHLELHPACEDCEASGRATPATQVDHVLPLRSRPELALEPSNLRSLCKACHSSKTLIDRHRGVGR